MPQRIPYHKGSSRVDAALAYEGRDDRLAAKRFYASTRWVKLRLSKLRANPLCESCEARGECTVAQQVHHKEERLKRPDLAFDWDNLESVCIACHNAKRTKPPRP